MFNSSQNKNKIESKKTKNYFLNKRDPTKIDLAFMYFHPWWKIKTHVILEENCLFV